MHRTFHRTHIFLSLVSLRCVLLLLVSCDTFLSHAPHVRVPQDESPAALSQKPVIRTPCHSWVFPSLSSFSSTPPPTWTPSPATLTGIRPNPCATSSWGGPSGHLADPTPATSYTDGRVNSEEHLKLPTYMIDYESVVRCVTKNVHDLNCVRLPSIAEIVFFQLCDA